MNIRRLFLSAALAFGLLFTQQAALLHELNHATGGDVVNASGDETRSGDTAHAFCEKCLAYAQVANAVTPHWVLPDAAPQRARETTPCATGTAGQTAPAACSRDPPRFL